MANITIEPATTDRFDDAQHALTGGGDGASCQCAWWTLTNAEFQNSSRDEREALLHDEMAAEPPAGSASVPAPGKCDWAAPGTSRRHRKSRGTTSRSGRSAASWCAANT